MKTRPLAAIAVVGWTLLLAMLIMVITDEPASSGDHALIHAAVARTSGTTRTYYIAADTVKWNFAPSGMNKITGKDFDGDALTFSEQSAARIGLTYLKSQYREYLNADFKTLKPIPTEWQHLGILGPVIRAEVGDTIKIIFRNNTPYSASMHPHGMFYEKNSEGAAYEDGTSGQDRLDDGVPSGGTHEYVWQARERSGPGPMDGPSVLWMYHSHVNEPADTNSGLIGPMIIYSSGELQADGTPKGIDREIVTMFNVFDENESLYLDENVKMFTREPATVDTEDEDFHESNLKHEINGYIYGNLPNLNMKIGDHVRWYVLAQGTEVDLHTPHWHGETVVINGMRTDVMELLPMSMKVADMVPDAPGVWQFHCHVNDHIKAGMQALFTVSPE